MSADSQKKAGRYREKPKKRMLHPKLKNSWRAYVFKAFVLLGSCDWKIR